MSDNPTWEQVNDLLDEKKINEALVMARTLARSTNPGAYTKAGVRALVRLKPIIIERKLDKDWGMVK